MTGNGPFLAVDVPDDAGEGVLSLDGGDGHDVGETGVPKQVDANSLSLHVFLGVTQARADEGEALRQRLHHLAESAVVAGGDGDPELAAGRRPVLLEGPGGAVGLRVDGAGLRQQRHGAHHGGDGQGCKSSQECPVHFVLLFAGVMGQPTLPSEVACNELQHLFLLDDACEVVGNRR